MKRHCIFMLMALFMLQWPASAHSNNYEYSNLNDFLEGVSRLYSPDLSVTVIVKGVGERGYGVSIGQTASGQGCLIAEIPTYVGRGNDLYCATLDHQFGYRGRGIRILRALEGLTGRVGHIDNMILHSGAVVSIKNVADSAQFRSVFQSGKIGKVALAGAYVDSTLGNAMDSSGIAWKSFANKGDLVVALTKTNLQTLGFSGKSNFGALGLLIFPAKMTGSVLGGALKVPHLMFFKSGLDPHPLGLYAEDIASWLGEKAPRELAEKGEKKGKKEDKSKVVDKSSPFPPDDGGGGGGGGGGGSGNTPDHGSTDGGDTGNGERMSLSEAMNQGEVTCEIGGEAAGSSVILKMEKATDQPLMLFIPAGTKLESNQGGTQSLGM